MASALASASNIGQGFGFGFVSCGFVPMSGPDTSNRVSKVFLGPRQTKCPANWQSFD